MLHCRELRLFPCMFEHSYYVSHSFFFFYCVSHSLTLCLSLPYSVCHSLTPCASFNFSLHVFHRVSHTLTLCLTLCLSLNVCHSSISCLLFWFSLHFSHCVSLPHSASLTQCLSRSQSVYLTPSLHAFHSVFLSPCVLLCLSLPHSVSPTLSPTLPLPRFVSHSVALCVLLDVSCSMPLTPLLLLCISDGQVGLYQDSQCQEILHQAAQQPARPKPQRKHRPPQAEDRYGSVQLISLVLPKCYSCIGGLLADLLNEFRSHVSRRKKSQTDSR